MLSDGADDSKLDAEFKDGVLTVHLAKTEKAESLGDDGAKQQRDRYIDRLEKKYTAFESMEDLLNAKGTYRHSLYLPSGERWIRHEVNLIADEYNRRQEARGNPQFFDSAAMRVHRLRVKLQ
jgi:hypothetical protein